MLQDLQGLEWWARQKSGNYAATYSSAVLLPYCLPFASFDLFETTMDFVIISFTP
jgi:hypothetical protein